LLLTLAATSPPWPSALSLHDALPIFSGGRVARLARPERLQRGGLDGAHEIGVDEDHPRRLLHRVRALAGEPPAKLQHPPEEAVRAPSSGRAARPARGGIDHRHLGPTTLPVPERARSNPRGGEIGRVHV